MHILISRNTIDGEKKNKITLKIDSDFFLEIFVCKCEFYYQINIGYITWIKLLWSLQHISITCKKNII